MLSSEKFSVQGPGWPEDHNQAFFEQRPSIWSQSAFSSLPLWYNKANIVSCQYQLVCKNLKYQHSVLMHSLKCHGLLKMELMKGKQPGRKPPHLG